MERKADEVRREAGKVGPKMEARNESKSNRSVPDKHNRLKKCVLWVP